MSSEFNRISWDEVFDIKVNALIETLKDETCRKELKSHYIFNSCPEGGKTTLLRSFYESIHSHCQCVYMNWRKNLIETR